MTTKYSLNKPSQPKLPFFFEDYPNNLYGIIYQYLFKEKDYVTLYENNKGAK